MRRVAIPPSARRTAGRLVCSDDFVQPILVALPPVRFDQPKLALPIEAIDDFPVFLRLVKTAVDEDELDVVAFQRTEAGFRWELLHARPHVAVPPWVEAAGTVQQPRPAEGGEVHVGGIDPELFTLGKREGGNDGSRRDALINGRGLA